MNTGKKIQRNRSLLVTLVVMVGLLNNGGVLAFAPSGPAKNAAQTHKPLLATTTKNELQLLGNILGKMRVVVVQGDYAYVAQENALFALSISSPNHPYQLAQALIFPDSIVDMRIAGQKLYLAASGSGMYIVDISNPSSLQILGGLDTPGSAQKLFVAGKNVFVADGSAGLSEIDVSDASAPKEIDSFVQPGDTTSVAVAGDYAYVTIEQNVPDIVDRLYVLNVSGPTLAVQGSYDFQGKPKDIAIKGNYAYLGSQGTSPQTGQDNRIRVIDVSDPTTPHEVGSVSAGELNFIKIEGNILFSSGGSGLGVFDISSPINSQLIIYLGQLYGSIQSAAIQGNYAYLATDSKGLRVINIQDLKKSYEVGTFMSSGMAMSGQISGDFLYVYSYGTDVVSLSKYTYRILKSTIWVIDVKEGYKPRITSELPIDCNGISGLKKIGNYLYISCSYQRLKIIDVSHPGSISEVGNLEIQTKSFAVFGNNLYLTDLGNIYLYDISNPASPVKIASHQISASPNYLATDGHYLYFGIGNNSLKIMDASDLQNITETGSIPLTDQIIGFHLAGDYLYLLGGGKLQIVDVSNRSAPFIVSSTTVYGAMAMTVIGDLVYLTGLGDVIYIYDLHVASSPQLIGSYYPSVYPTSGTYPDSVSVKDDFVFLTEGISGLRVYQMTHSSNALINPSGSEISLQIDPVSYLFPSGIFSDSVVFSQVPKAPLGIYPALLRTTGIEFENTANNAFYLTSVQPNKPYTLTVSYKPTKLNAVLEDSLGLYYWSGQDWELVPSNKVDLHAHKITAKATSLGRFAVLGSSQRYFLPVITANLSQKTSTLDLSIDRVEITQAVQDAANGVPLVANRPTFIRVHARTQGQATTDNVKLMIQAWRGGAALPGSPVILGPWSVFNSGDANKFGSTFDFALPRDWLTGEVTFQFNLDPDNAIAELDEGNNSYTFSAVFNDVPPLELKIVPVNYTHTPTGDYIPGQIPQTYDAINEMFPISQLNISIRDPIDFAGDLTQSGDVVKLLDKITSLKESDNAPSSQVYFGVIPGSDIFSLTFAGFGWIGARASIGFPGDSIMAHEIGHNFGRKHSPCGVSDTLDSHYPYADGLIGQWGFDYNDLTIMDPNYMYDFMSYCGPAWVSDYTYKGLYQDQIKHGNQVEAKPYSDNFFIRAAITTSGTLDLQPLYILPYSTADTEEPSDYSVEMLNSSGEVVAVHNLPVYQLDMSSNAAPSFFVRLPVPVEQVSRLRFRFKDQILAELALNSVALHLPKTLTLQPSQENWSLRWGMPDVPALIRYSTDQGITWTTLDLDVTGGELVFDAARFRGQKVQFQVIFSGVSSPSEATLETTYNFPAQ